MNSEKTTIQELARAHNFHRDGNLTAAEEIYTTILIQNPLEPDALHSLALIKFAQNNALEAERLILNALPLRPPSPVILLNYGLILAALNKTREALISFDKAIKLKPDYLEAHYNKGIILYSLGQYEAAINSLKKTLKINPNYTSSLFALYKTLMKSKNYEKAEEYFKKILKKNQNITGAFNFRGQILFELKDYTSALKAFDTALSYEPYNAAIINNKATTLKLLCRFEEAAYSYEQAIKLQPDFLQAHINMGATQEALLNFEKSLLHYRKALEIEPENSLALLGMSNLFIRMKKFDRSLKKCDRILSINPNNIHALNNKGICYFELNDLENALLFFKAALKLDPTYLDGLANCGETQIFLNKFSEALETFKTLISLDPFHSKALDGLAVASLRSSSWENFDKIKNLLEQHIENKSSIITPFTLLGYCDDPALQLKCAKIYAQSKFISKPKHIFNKMPSLSGKLRIGYASADFKEHATAYLIAELFEKHDRSRYEINAFSFSQNDKSIIQKRIIKSFDKFNDITNLSDEEAAEFINKQEIDILVDLKGYTGQARTGIFCYKPAPIQVSYLGFPNTMAVDFMDYFITDKIASPDSLGSYFTEKLVFLPDSYQINDSKQQVPFLLPSKRDVGLPDNGFVFCSFNNNWKINPIIFEIWTRLLNKVPNSVLWLLRDNEISEKNLIKEAEQRGIDKKRIIFAERIEHEYHLARQPLADLFLDTVPCNAHTTASDALWSGLPVITCLGSSFSARVAASIINAAGMPELITHSLEDYESLAFKIASNPIMIQELKNKLSHNRTKCALFDSTRTTRNLEKAFDMMYENFRHHRKPQNIIINE